MIPGYSISESLSEDHHWQLYRCVRIQDALSVLIRTTRGQSPDPLLTEQLQSEYGTLKNISIPGVLKAHDLVVSSDNTALILEDPGGVLLDKLLASHRFDTAEFLRMSIQISSIIADLHHHKVVHTRLQPGAILLSKNGQKVWLSGFEYAIKLNTAAQTRIQAKAQAQAQAQVEGKLAYIAPEQTGRIEENIDYRTDLYSLGIIFYEMLTGKLPFETEDPLELVYCHLARIPQAPSDVDQKIPQSLSNIVMRLLKKKAGERYKSAKGLLEDLKECDQQYRANGSISTLTLAKHDRPELLEIPDRLYGRSVESEQLLSVFNSVCNGGSRLVLVSGYSGVGKTSLIKHIHDPVVQQKAYFVSGKYDQLDRSNSYSAILQAFWELATQILTETDAEIEQWKQRILDALGVNAQVIIEVIPELELIIGKQPPVAELKPVEAQNRFNLYFQKFISVLARPERPLVLFLDDLQWASMSSIRLLQSWVSGAAINGLLLIGAYRDNEVDAKHPLRVVMRELQETGVALEEIALKPLALNSVSRIIQDTVACSEKDALPLALCVLEKTQGNPFFTRVFLYALYEEGQLYIDEFLNWAWDVDAITSRRAADNVVDLMAHKIQRLPLETRDVIKLAACIGNRFTLPTLATAYTKSAETTALHLEPALRNRLILHQDENAFTFYHDRIQEAAYGLIPEEKREQVHYQIGTLLHARASKEELNEHVFEIVNHLNIGKSLIRDAGEKKVLAELNLQAGLKAKTSTAYGSAHAYFSQGTDLLPPDAWTQDYALAFDLFRECSECAYLCGYYEEAETGFDLLMEKAQSKREQGTIYNMRIVQYENLSRFPEAAALGREALVLFDITFPENEEKKLKQVNEDLQVISQQMAGKQVADLVNLPVMQDADIKICMKLLMTMWAPNYISGDMPMTMLIACCMVRLSLQHGNTEESAYGYVIHAINIAALNDDYQSAYDYGQLALAINRQFDDITARAKVNHMFSCYIGFWREHIKESFKYSRAGYQAGIESGDFTYGGYSGFHESWHALFSGMNLEQYNEEYSAKLEFLSGYQYQSIADAHQLMLQWGRCLQGETGGPLSLDGNGFSEQAYQENYGQVPFFIAFYYVAKLNTRYLMMDYPAAMSYAELAETVIHGVRGMIWDALLCFNHALALSASFASLASEQQKTALEKLDALSSRMKLWADNAPQNFAQQYDLIQAEISRIQGHFDEAITHYESAIKASNEQGFINIEALANELCGRFWLHRNQLRVAGIYLEESARLYREWGAHAKAEQLEKTFDLLPDNSKQQYTTSHKQSHEQSAARQNASLAVSAILKVSQAISSEMVMDKLVEQLIQIVMENAGAERGLLLCPAERQWILEAQGVVEGDAINVTMPTVTETTTANTSAWSSGIVNYVSRTHGYLLTADARKDNRLSGDAYIRDNEIKSVLCVPIIHQQQLTAMLYLENNLSSNVFTDERVLLVQALASQAAIALRNALLYSDVMSEIDERRQAESALRVIATGTAAATGEDFFRLLVQSLASSFNVKCAFVAECLDPGNQRVRTLAFMNEGKFTDNFEYDVKGTPCEGVLQGNVSYYPDDLEKLYPIEKGFESYLAAPAIDLSGRVLGHLALLDTSDMRHLPHAESILKIFATRVGVELHRKRTQQALQASEEKYRLLIENQTDLIVKLNRDGQLQFVSPSYCEMFSLGESELQGTNFHQQIHSSDRERVGQEWAKLFSEPWTAQFEHRVNTATGERWLGWALKALHDDSGADDSGAVIEIIGVGRDVTDRRLAEEQARQNLHTLAHAGRLQSMGEMASTLAHELNQPLTAILSFSQAGQRLINTKNYDKDELAFALERTAVNAKRAGDIISHMRDFIRKDDSQTEWSDINRLISEAIDLVSSELLQQEIDVVLELQEPLPPVPVDPVQIQQVILNLVRNSMEALETKGEKKSANERRITITTRIENSSVNNPEGIEVTVTDTGPGLDAEIVEKIYNTFVTTKAEGMGIGLSICRSIVEAHGGELVTRQRLGGGAIFSFVLPTENAGQQS